MNSPVLSLSRRLRRSPYEARSHVGVKNASVYNHVVLPTIYESLEVDYWHLREHVQIWDVACQVQVEVKGPDALKMIEYLTPRDVSRCTPGQCIYAPFVDQNGGIINDPLVLCLEPDRYWVSLSDSDVLLWIKGLASGQDYDIEIWDPDVFPCSIQGPKSEALLSRLIEQPISKIRFFRFIESHIDGMELIIARTGWSGQDGFELYPKNASDSIDIWDKIVECGADLNLRSGCPNLIDRIEAGLLSFGNDMTLANNPFEAGLDRFFQLGKPADYLGQASLEEIARVGVTQRLVRLRVQGEPITNPRDIYELKSPDSDEMGIVTSIVYSPRLGVNIGFGYVPINNSDVGNPFTVLTPNGELSGSVASHEWSADGE